MIENKDRNECSANASRTRKWLSGVACLLIAWSPQGAFANDPLPAPPPQAPPPQEAPPPGETQPQRFTQVELEKLLAPIALFPDALLAQLLPASAYPIEIVQAQRWLDRNTAAAARQDFTAADNENWDPSVKAMLRFPTVLKKLNDDLGWTTSLGDAIINQPEDVANVIQLLRAKAQKAGALKSGKEIQVVTRREGPRDVVVIESTDPSLIFVPQYDPVAVFAPAPYDGTGAAIAAGLLTFGAAVAIGTAWRGNYWNWGAGTFYPPVWPGYPAWRAPYPGWRPGARSAAATTSTSAMTSTSATATSATAIGPGGPTPVIVRAAGPAASALVPGGSIGPESAAAILAAEISAAARAVALEAGAQEAIWAAARERSPARPLLPLRGPWRGRPLGPRSIDPPPAPCPDRPAAPCPDRPAAASRVPLAALCPDPLAAHSRIRAAAWRDPAAAALPVPRDARAVAAAALPVPRDARRRRRRRRGAPPAFGHTPQARRRAAGAAGEWPGLLSLCL